MIPPQMKYDELEVPKRHALNDLCCNVRRSTTSPALKLVYVIAPKRRRHSLEVLHVFKDDHKVRKTIPTVSTEE